LVIADDDQLFELWELPPLALAPADVTAAAALAGDAATVVFDDPAMPRTATIRAPGLVVALSPRSAEIEYAPDARDRADAIAAQLLSRRRRWRWLTHDDLAIAIGMAAPLAAGLAAPPQHARWIAAVGAIPWLGYLLWVRHNTAHHWCTFSVR
jgi:hypothetical protein